MYYISILLTIIANIFYHIFQKSIPNNVNPIASLVLTYGTALVGSVIILMVYSKNSGIESAFKGLNWTSGALGLAIILLELGFLLAYRSGWDVSFGAIVSNVSVTLLLIPIGMIFFKEHVSIVNLLGIPFCLLGLFLINK